MPCRFFTQTLRNCGLECYRVPLRERGFHGLKAAGFLFIGWSILRAVDAAESIYPGRDPSWRDFLNKAGYLCLFASVYQTSFAVGFRIRPYRRAPAVVEIEAPPFLVARQ